MTERSSVFVLRNPAGIGVGLPLGVYSTLELAVDAAMAAGMPSRIDRFELDAPADYAGGETVWHSENA